MNAIKSSAAALGNTPQPKPILFSYFSGTSGLNDIELATRADMNKKHHKDPAWMNLPQLGLSAIVRAPAISAEITTPYLTCYWLGLKAFVSSVDHTL